MATAHPAATAAPQAHEHVWTEEYTALLQDWGAAGALPQAPPGGERRAHPRFRLRSGTLGVQSATGLPVRDVSAGGVAFRSRCELAPGQVLNLVLANTFLVEVSVVKSRPAQEADAGARRWPYRIHCRMARPEDGVRLLVMLAAMGDLLLEPAPA